MDIGKDLQRAYDDGYEQGKQDAVTWIPVTEQLPEENDRYLTVMHRTVDPQYRAEFGDDDTEVRITQYYKGEWKLPRHSPEWINEVITDIITHWMQLPELPQDGEEND